MVNKIDTITIEEVDRIAHQPDTVVLSCQHMLNVEFVKEMIWDYLHLIRIYCKPKSQAPDLNQPVIMRNHSTVVNFCRAIHRQLEANFSYALVWGQSVKHKPQRVGKKHLLHDEDVVQIMQKV